MDGFRDLVQYSQVDDEKYLMIKNTIVHHQIDSMRLYAKSYDSLENDAEISDISCQIAVRKICPKCRREFPSRESICPDCLVRLRDADSFNPIMEIKLNPEFEFKGQISCGNFEDLINDENASIIETSDFSIDDFRKIVRDIQKTAFLRLDNVIRDESIEIDELDILNNTILFAKSFVNVDYKAQGMELGYFEFNRIYIDDRQSDSQQIITLIHELSHFLLKEILTHCLCSILNVSKNEYVEAFTTFTLSNVALNQLIDEYAAHTVEARFTMFGYQDYSSFLSIQHDLDSEEVSVAKMVGNNFSNCIRDILESYLDVELRKMIKTQFRNDTFESPDYSRMKHESCKVLSDNGFMRAVKLMLLEGFENADGEILEQYRNQFLQP